MFESAFDRLARKTTIGDTVTFKGDSAGKVEDEVSKLNRDRDYKFFLQLIRLSDRKAKEMRSKYAYRLCYWAVSEDEDKVPFGQYATLLSEGDLRQILREVRHKRWPVMRK